MNYKDNENNQENNIYSSYMDIQNEQINNNNNTKDTEEKPYIVLTDKEYNKKRSNNKFLTYIVYAFFLVVVGITYYMYIQDKYEFYINKNEIVLANNSSYQIELTPKNEKVFDYKNYKYESTNKDVAIVDETGKVTATGIGEAEIKIKYKNGFQEKIVKVKTEELGDSEIESAYKEGQIETVVKGREEVNVDVEYVSTTPLIEVDEYGHVEREEDEEYDEEDDEEYDEGDDEEEVVIIHDPTGGSQEVEIPREETKIEVEKIEVIENNILIKVGTKGKINVRITPENASDKTLSYVSNNGNVEVDNEGNIIGKNKGESIITITSSNGNKAYCVVKVTEEDKKIEKIDINPKEIEMKVGQTKEIIAEITPKDATEREIIWESSNEKVVKVNNGKVTGIGIGEAEVVARTTDGRIRESSKIKVKAKTIEVTELKLTTSKIALKVGSKYNLQVEVVPNNATNQKLTYKSNNDNVTVDGAGLITAKKVGKSVITITSNNGKSVKCEVEVTTNEVTVKSIKLNTNNIEIKKGESYYAKATVEPVNATDSNVTWTSSKTSVATVTNGGRIVGKGKGEATITAKTPNGKSASIKVKVTVPVSKVTISGESKIRVGARTTYKAEIKPSDASNKDVKWTSSNTKIATIDSKGKITGKGVGIATIIAVVDGKKVTKTIEVVAKETPVKSIEITPKEVTLELGHTTTATLTVNYTPGNATGQSIKEWKSSNTGVVKVSSNGTITAVEAGTATITAKSSNGKISTCKVTVNPNSTVPTKVILNYTGTHELDEGGILTLKATLEPTTVTDTLTWTSSKTSVATVDKKGKVKTVKEGSAVIKVKTSNNLSASVTIKVNNKDNEVTSVSVAPSNISLDVGETYQLKATVNPSNATNKTITWTSSDKNIASVTDNGEVKAIKNGKVTITAKSTNGKTAKCVVTVNNVKTVKVIAENDFFKNFSPKVQSKEALLKYYKEKFKKIDNPIGYSSTSSGSDRRLVYLAMNNTLAYHEDYLGHESIEGDEYKEYTIKIGKNVSGYYVLTSLKKSTDLISIKSKETDKNEDKPYLLIEYNDGTTQKLNPEKDTFIRAGDYKDKNYGNNELIYVRHVPNTKTNEPFSDQSMRGYISFDTKKIVKSDVKAVTLHVKAKLSREKKDTVSDKSIDLVLMEAYYSDWADENKITWAAVAAQNAIAHYSYDGLEGNFDWKKPANTPSQFIYYNTRFNELDSLCKMYDGEYKKEYLKKAKEILLDFVNDYFDPNGVNKNGKGIPQPQTQAIEPAKRVDAFPGIYKVLLENNILNAEENYRILCWLYKEMDGIYKDNSGKLFDGATAEPKGQAASGNHAIFHLYGFSMGIAYFDEFKDIRNWKDVFIARLNYVYGEIILKDGSFNEADFAYASSVVTLTKNIISAMNYYAKNNNSDTEFTDATKYLESKIISLSRYLIYCSYQDGATPYFGDGGRGEVKSRLEALLNVINEGHFKNDDKIKGYLEEIKAYLANKLSPKMMKFSGINIVTDRTGNDNKIDSTIFMNAKIGGAHNHRDTLSLLFYYRGRELLKDTGITSYDTEHPAYKFQKLRTNSHNTIEINETAQIFNRNINVKDSTIDISGNSGMSTITSSTKATKGFIHYRNVTYAKKLGGILFVSDYVNPDETNSSKNNTYTQNWHTAINNNANFNSNENDYRTYYSQGSNLIIAQADKNNIKASLEEGYDASSKNKTQYFSYKQEGSGDIFYQTVLYPTPGSAEKITVTPKSLIRTNKESAIKVYINKDNENPNKKIYSYTSFSEQKSGKFKDNNTEFKFVASHFVVSYDSKNQIKCVYINNGSKLEIGELVVFSAKSKITDLTLFVDEATLYIETSYTKAFSINLDNNNIKTIMLNNESLSNDKYNIKNGTINIKSK